jgi:hypothetical protein
MPTPAGFGALAITNSDGSSASTKKRTRTAGAPVLLQAGF